MNHNDHASIAVAIKAAGDTFSPGDRIAHHAAFLQVVNYLAVMLSANNPDDFRREKFIQACGIQTTQDQRDRMRSALPKA